MLGELDGERAHAQDAAVLQGTHRQDVRMPHPRLTDLALFAPSRVARAVHVHAYVRRQTL